MGSMQPHRARAGGLHEVRLQVRFTHRVGRVEGKETQEARGRSETTMGGAAEEPQGAALDAAR